MTGRAVHFGFSIVFVIAVACVEFAVDLVSTERCRALWLVPLLRIDLMVDSAKLLAKMLGLDHT